MSGWSEERLKLAHKHYVEEGLSAALTARLLGGGVTRNAVIGIAARKGWKRSGILQAANYSHGQSRMKKASPKPRPPKPVWKPAVVIGGGPTGEREAVPVPPPETPGCDLIALDSHRCKWPIGDPLKDGFGFCGHQKAEAEPYCVPHLRRAHQPTKASVDTPAKLERSVRRYL